MARTIEQGWVATATAYDSLFDSSGELYAKGIDLVADEVSGIAPTSAKIYANKMIITADIAETEKVILTVPIGLTVIGASIINTNALTNRTIQVLNGSDAITDAMASGDTTTGDLGVVYAASITLANADFLAAAEDLTIAVAGGTGDWTGTIIIDFVLS